MDDVDKYQRGLTRAIIVSQGSEGAVMKRPARRHRHTTVSRGLSDLDAILQSGESQRPQLDELARIVRSLHQIEEAIGVPVADLLQALTDDISPVRALLASRAMTADQKAALRAAGSYVDEMPPAAERASTILLHRKSALIASALSTDEAAARLRVTPGQVRQRLSNHTLLAVKVGAVQRLPDFQFTADGELPGWNRVAPAFPSTAHPTAVAWFMQALHPDLTVDGETLSPSQWLSGGGATERIVDLITTAFVTHAS